MVKSPVQVAKNIGKRLKRAASSLSDTSSLWSFAKKKKKKNKESDTVFFGSSSASLQQASEASLSCSPTPRPTIEEVPDEDDIITVEQDKEKEMDKSQENDGDKKEIGDPKKINDQIAVIFRDKILKGCVLECSYNILTKPNLCTTGFHSFYTNGSLRPSLSQVFGCLVGLHIAGRRLSCVWLDIF